MTEIELKFQVPAARREAVASAVAGRAAAKTLRLQAAYFDTADHALATAGVALRLRREGTRWVQTLKAAGGDAMTRLEHDVPRAGPAATMPPLDLSLHEGTPAGQRLAQALARAADATLVCQYRTDIRRTSRGLRARGAALELAFDQGRIAAGDRSLPVCELEFELQRGEPAALLAAARPWVRRHGLWLDTRSKAERGTLLAAGMPRAPARKAAAVRLEADKSLGAARRAVLAECLQQIAANASQVASGDFGDEHVHQLRVGLRRLRTALRLFATGGEAEPLGEAAAALFRALGAARDRAAVEAPLRARLAEALAATGLRLVPPALPAAEAAAPDAVVRAEPAQRLLLDLIEATLPVAPDLAAEPPAEFLPRRLSRWHRAVVRDAQRFAALDDESRHRLRKRVKRLRYGVEFARGLFGAKKVARYLRALAAVQERLGELNDATVALDSLRQADGGDPAVAFALGWLAARREALVAGCGPALGQFAEVRPPWKR
jgi:inorganic triphosphatase YgiF